MPSGYNSGVVDLDFQSRIGFSGNLGMILKKVSEDYGIGDYLNHKVITMGYEDFNLIMETSKGKYMVKIYSTFRDENECRRYVEVMEKVIGAGVRHPELYSVNGEGLYIAETKESSIRLSVLEFVDGETFYDSGEEPTDEESVWVIRQVTKINSIEFKPSFIYDSWAISNFSQEYEKRGEYLRGEDARQMSELAEIFKKLNISGLPHSFVHGDITRTNTMKNKKGNLFIIDFAVANWYPRIQELAVLFCDLFFNSKNPKSFPERFRTLLEEYKKEIKLTWAEESELPTYIQMAHAMHLLRANYEKVVNKNNTVENEYFLNIGRIGLKYTRNLWKS